MSRQTSICVMPYDPTWPDRAKRHAEHISEVLGPVLVRWMHIGSTSIPGIHAKPIIDLMPLVTSVEAVDDLRPAIEAAGYDWYGEFGLPGRRYINRDDTTTGQRLTNIHIYAADNPEVERHLAFRDYLRGHPAVAREYEAVKIACAEQNPTDIYGYMDCKDSICKRIEREAVECFRSGR